MANIMIYIIIYVFIRIINKNVKTAKISFYNIDFKTVSFQLVRV